VQKAQTWLIQRLYNLRFEPKERLASSSGGMEKNPGTLVLGRNTMLPPADIPTLKELGISRIQSSRWQRLASIPDEKFEEYLARTVKASQKGALRLVHGYVERSPSETAAAQGRPLRTVKLPSDLVEILDKRHEKSRGNKRNQVDQTAANNCPSSELRGALLPSRASQCWINNKRKRRGRGRIRTKVIKRRYTAPSRKCPLQTLTILFPLEVLQDQTPRLH
jgi:hypothetical protein